MEQITVDRQNCCVILPCRNQEARLLCTYCGNWPLETQTYWVTPPEAHIICQKAQAKFTRGWRADVRLRTKLYWKPFLRRRHYLQYDTVPLECTAVSWYSPAHSLSRRAHPAVTTRCVDRCRRDVGQPIRVTGARRPVGALMCGIYFSLCR